MLGKTEQTWIFDSKSCFLLDEQLARCRVLKQYAMPIGKERLCAANKEKRQANGDQAAEENRARQNKMFRKAGKVRIVREPDF